MKFELSVNGHTHEIDAEPEQPLLWVLRDTLGLVGTRFGCGVGHCGACTVLLGGVAQRSCQTPVSAVGETAIETIELVSDPIAQALQDAWVRHNVPQCGYCQSGQLMSARALLHQDARPSVAKINATMAGNVCRCGTYPRIRAAIADAAEQLATSGR